LAAPIASVGHLRLERRLNQRFHRRTHEILVPRQKSFQLDNFPLTLALGHGVLPHGSVTLNITSMP
jgi:hypothetical protein